MCLRLWELLCVLLRVGYLILPLYSLSVGGSCGRSRALERFLEAFWLSRSRERPYPLARELVELARELSCFRWEREDVVVARDDPVPRSYPVSSRRVRLLVRVLDEDADVPRSRCSVRLLALRDDESVRAYPRDELPAVRPLERSERVRVERSPLACSSERRDERVDAVWSRVLSAARPTLFLKPSMTRRPPAGTALEEEPSAPVRPDSTNRLSRRCS